MRAQQGKRPAGGQTHLINVCDFKYCVRRGLVNAGVLGAMAAQQANGRTRPEQTRCAANDHYDDREADRYTSAGNAALQGDITASCLALCGFPPPDQAGAGGRPSLGLELVSTWCHAKLLDKPRGWGGGLGAGGLN